MASISSDKLLSYQRKAFAKFAEECPNQSEEVLLSAGKAIGKIAEDLILDGYLDVKWVDDDGNEITGEEWFRLNMPSADIIEFPNLKK